MEQKDTNTPETSEGMGAEMNSSQPMSEAPQDTMATGGPADGGSPEKGEGSFGPLVAIIIIVIILILGGLYFWGQRADISEPIIPADDTIVETLETQSTSDEIVDIDADLEATDLDNLDADLAAIEGELEF